jgi:uroporphyrinogen decarboxylase
MEDLVGEVGIDAYHSFQDVIMPVADFHRRYGGRIGVIGGVDMDALARMPPPEFRRYVRRILEQVMPRGRYALGAGNSLANYVRPENYLARLEEGWNYSVSRQSTVSVEKRREQEVRVSIDTDD